VIKMSKFKDPCDKCGKFDYLTGYKGKCYCPECLKKVQEEEKSEESKD